MPVAAATPSFKSLSFSLLLQSDATIDFRVAFPMAYDCVEDLDSLKEAYECGRLSLREVIESVDLGPDASYEDYCEIFDYLLD